MFNETWVVLAVFIGVLGILSGQASLLTLAVLLMTIVPAGWVWDRLALRAVSYQRDFGEVRAFVGETVPLTLRVTNRKPLPVPWLRIEDAFPEAVPLTERELDPSSIPTRSILVNVVSLRWYERISWTYHLKCARRGFYFFGPVTLRSGDIFGLFESAGQFPEIDRLIVYPRVVPLPELGFPGKEPFGEATGRRAIFEDPIRTVGIRDYHPEDSFKHVHWKATARQQQLQVKVYEPTVSQHLVVFLNIATYTQPWIGIDPDKQEHAISVAASIAYHATRHRYAVGLIANGSVPKSDQSIKVLPSRDPGQLTRILEALAAVTSFATVGIEKLVLAESPHLPWGATLVVVTVVVTEELLVSLVRLRDAGRRVVLVSMDPSYQDDPPPGITVFHLPEARVTYGAGQWDGVGYQVLGIRYWE
jgi:uncharacterized protein (DUF58 family)